MTMAQGLIVNSFRFQLRGEFPNGAAFEEAFQTEWELLVRVKALALTELYGETRWLALTVVAGAKSWKWDRASGLTLMGCNGTRSWQIARAA